MASPDELLAMLEEAAEEAENAHRYGLEDALHQEPEDEYAEILEDLTNEIIDEVTLGLCFDVHKSCKIGTFLLDDIDRETELKFGIVVEKGKDVFGQVPMKKQLECVCPNCQRNLAASRFAPHLEKCMGMGRNSSRIASRRIAKSGKKDSDDSDGDEENQKDDEWLTERKVKKQRRDRSTNSPRRSKSLKAKNSVIDRSSDIPSVGSNASNDSGNNLPIHETLSKENCRSLLSQTCGVISEHTKKMCTRSHRCPQHSDEQRRAVRAHLLGQQGLLPDDDIQVDIDTYEEGDSQALRDSLQWDAASNPSPADSTSTINSTTSSRKKKTTKSKKKSNAKISNSTGVDTPNSMYDFSTI